MILCLILTLNFELKTVGCPSSLSCVLALPHSRPAHQLHTTHTLVSVSPLQNINYSHLVPGKTSIQ